MKKINFSSTILCALALSIAISSCTPEKRALLKTTAVSFADQAITAIDLTQTVYQIEEPHQSPEKAMEDTVKELLEQTNPDYYWGNIQKVNQMIVANQPNSSPSNLKKELDAVKDEYKTAALLYQEVEKVDYESDRLVKEAKDSAKRLTLKMYILGKRILEHPPRPLDSKRLVLAEKLAELDREYHKLKEEHSNTNTSSKRIVEIEKRLEGIKNEVREKVGEWLTVNKNEKKMLCDTVLQTQKAVATGVRLSQLSDTFGKVDLDVIFSRLNEVVGISSSLTGKDYSNIKVHFNNMAKTIDSDQNLKTLLIEMLPKKNSSDNNQKMVSEFLSIKKTETELDCSDLGGN